MRENVMSGQVKELCNYELKEQHFPADSVIEYKISSNTVIKTNLPRCL